MTRLSVLALLVVCAVLTAATPVQAEFISWSGSWSVSPLEMNSDDGTGRLTLVPSTIGGFGSSNYLAVGLGYTGPSTATFTNQGYGLTLHLTDNTSHTSADLHFTGEFSGTIGHYSLTNTFTSPPKQSVTLGGTQYTVALKVNLPTSSPLDWPEFTAFVAVNAPEPSSLALAGLGLSALGLHYWRRVRCPSRR